MRTSSAILIVATLVVAATGSAQATDILTASLRSSNAGGGHYCTAVNKSPTANTTVKLEIISPGNGTLVSCASVVLAPQTGTWCYGNDYGFGSLAYCKITTSSVANTRGALMVLGAAYEAVSSVDNP